MSSREYTGREIAIFTDVHGLIEPLDAVLCDICSRGIKEIYSLGDNIGLGPSSDLVLDMLDGYNVRSMMGEFEEYCLLGVKPFSIYFDNYMRKSQEWLMSTLDHNRIDFIRNFSHSIDLNIGSKNVVLCHFANDVRFDFMMHDYFTYLRNFNNGDAYRQFLHTNSMVQKEEIQYNLDRFGYDNSRMRGYLSALHDPLFGGKMISYYDAVIQGHVHYKLHEKGNDTDFLTIRSLGFDYRDKPIDMASYVILRERTNNQGFDIEEVLVKFDREKMEESVIKSSEPTGMIKKHVRMK